MSNFMFGVIVTLIVMRITWNTHCQNELIRDVIIDELLKENEIYREFVEKQFTENNETNWD